MNLKRTIAVVTLAVSLWGCGNSMVTEPDRLPEDKTVLVCGTLEADVTELETAVRYYNLLHPDAQIELRNYSEMEQPLASLQTDIASGRMPDILNLDGLPASYLDKGIFADLTPFYEQDEELNAGDIAEPLLEAMKTDGALYYVAPYYELVTLGGHAADVGEGDGWTFQEMKALIEEKDEDVRPFFWESKSEILDELFWGNGLSDFVDESSGACRFDSQEFKDMLQICSRGTDEMTDYHQDELTLIRDGKVLFWEGVLDPRDIPAQEALYGEDFRYIGFPNPEKNGSFFRFPLRLGICDGSAHKEDAWQFLRNYMTAAYQSDPENGIGGMPARKDCLESCLAHFSYTESDIYTDPWGHGLAALNGISEYENGLVIETKPLTKKQIDKYLSVLNRTRRVEQIDDTIRNILMEEAEPYFAGDRSLEDTVSYIQNRVQTYLGETRS